MEKSRQSKPVPVTNPDQNYEETRSTESLTQAFATLYDQFAPAIYRYLLSRLGNVEEARDVTAETFLKAFEAFPRYKHEGFFSAWIFSIARSKCVDIFRRSRKYNIPMDENLIDPLPDLDSQITDRERRRKLSLCIQGLKPGEIELLRLRYVAELTYAEIAEILKRNEEAVKKSIYRLQNRLYEQMEK